MPPFKKACTAFVFNRNLRQSKCNVSIQGNFLKAYQRFPTTFVFVQIQTHLYVAARFTSNLHECRHDQTTIYIQGARGPKKFV